MDKHEGMLFILVELCIVITLGNGAPVQKPTLTNAAAVEYLVKYNYITKTVSSDSVDPNTLKEAVRTFQKMGNLKVTGELNSETLNTMTLPRCGFKDNGKKKAGNYAAAEPWPKKKLSWKIEQYATTDKLTEDEQTDAIARAFDIWASKSKLKFSYVENENDPADINLKFVAGRHGDGSPFDGPMGVLAHAEFPTDGSVHFDDDENWLLGTKAQKKGIELFIVAAHEIGHALGLDHTDVSEALMYPYYSYSSNLVLDQDDIDGIQSLYGKPGKPGKNGKKGKKGKKNGKNGKQG